jgi:hypothetical protein
MEMTALTSGVPQLRVWRLKHLIVIVWAAAFAASSRVAHADETATVVLEAPGVGEVTPLNLLDRELPAGVTIKVRVPIAGSDPTNGSLLVWPALADRECKIIPSRDAPQRHEVGLVANGSAESRVLEGTIPPLQLATRYCLRVSFDRYLSSEILHALAKVVATTPIDWKTTCQCQDREAYIVGRFTERLRSQLEIYGPKIALEPGHITQAATKLAKTFGIDAHCVQVTKAIAHRDELGAQHNQAKGKLTTTKYELLCIPQSQNNLTSQSCAKPSPRLFAWPSAVRKVGSEVQVMTMADALEPNGLSALVASLGDAAPAVVTELRSLVSITATDQRAALERLKAHYATRPTVAQPLALFLPTLNHHVDLARLYDTDRDGGPTVVARQMYAALLESLSSNATVVIDQLQQMRRDDPRLADQWIELLTTLRDANQNATTTERLVKEGEAAVDTIAASIATDLEQVVQTDAVKDVLRMTTVNAAALFSSKAPATDEKGSWISPNIGVLAALPVIERRGVRGISTGWVAPYAGASIYFTRVDRVIDFQDLVGDTFWQRNSLTIGGLLSTPSVNGKDVRGPWSISVVPVVGFGHRVTQYFRVDAGMTFFTHADMNPVIVDSHWGVAVWIGASLDADIWAVVSGKLGR